MEIQLTKWKTSSLVKFAFADHSSFEWGKNLSFNPLWFINSIKSLVISFSTFMWQIKVIWIMYDPEKMGENKTVICIVSLSWNVVYMHYTQKIFISMVINYHLMVWCGLFSKKLLLASNFLTNEGHEIVYTIFYGPWSFQLTYSKLMRFMINKTEDPSMS